MLTINRSAVLQTAEDNGWSLENHVDRVYGTFRFRGGKPPKLVTRPGEVRPAIQQSLMDWNADLGARDRMDWDGFLAKHQRILTRLATLPRLGKLASRDIDTVCGVVEELENFKSTAGRKLVFGSKAAHFHFPWLVPVVSSEVHSGLAEIERTRGRDVEALVPGTGRRFRYTSPEACSSCFRAYVVFGNVLVRDIDSRRFLGNWSSAKHDLHAKIFEWWVIAQRQRGQGHR